MSKINYAIPCNVSEKCVIPSGVSHLATSESFVSQSSFPNAKFMTFITFECRDKTCSKIEKNLVSMNSVGG